MSPRPRYEKPIDVGFETEALDILMMSLGPRYTWDTAGKNSELDATVYRDGVFYCDVEVKTRNPKFFSQAQHEGYVLSAQKWFRLLSMDARLLVYWKNEGVYALRPIAAPQISIRRGGRTVDTRDEWDIEDVVYIPWEYFKLIGHKGE